MLTQKTVRELFDYYPNTGFLFWKADAYVYGLKGKRAGALRKKDGYRTIQIDGVRYQEHRIIWLFIYGDIKIKTIDHINHIRHDNRIINLRLVTPLESNLNQSKNSNNKSGCNGVHWFKTYNKWVAQLTINYKKKHLGYYVDWFDAVCARKSAEVKYGFHPNHGK